KSEPDEHACQRLWYSSRGRSRRIGTCKGTGGVKVQQHALKRLVELGGEDVLHGTRRTEAWGIRSVSGIPLCGNSRGRISSSAVQESHRRSRRSAGLTCGRHTSTAVPHSGKDGLHVKGDVPDTRGRREGHKERRRSQRH